MRDCLHHGPPSTPMPLPQLQQRPRQQTLLAALSLVLAWLAAPAQAVDFVSAQAFQNLDPATFTDTNTGTTATAQKEYDPVLQRGSIATTTRTSTQATAYGFGTGVTTHYNALSSTRSQFTLWDLAGNSALSSAAGLGLSFNFTLAGQLLTGPTSISSANLAYEAELRNAFNGVSQERLATAGSAYGPGPGGVPGYVNVGDPTLQGSFVQNFSLLHTTGDLVGTLFLNSNTTSSNNSRALVGLNLDSITLASGSAPLGGLGVRLDQTGQILPVVAAVPEPSTWAMFMAGALGMGVWRRRQRRNCNGGRGR